MFGFHKACFLGLPTFSMFLALYSFGCGPSTNHCVTLQISGPPNDTLSWSAAPLSQAQGGVGPACTGSTAKTAGAVQTDSLGDATANNVIDSAGYLVEDNSNPPTCEGTADYPYHGPATVPLSCNLLPGNAPTGSAAIGGNEQVKTVQLRKCVVQPNGTDLCGWYPTTEYDFGAVSLNIDGTVVSTYYGQGSTAASVALQLAQAIDSNSTLSSLLVAVPRGTGIEIRALQSGSQYDYPWSTSCTYNTLYFSGCSFSSALAPSGALAAPATSTWY